MLTVTTSAGVEYRKAPVVGQGLRYQVAEVHRCLRQGALESPVIPHTETLSLAATMDRIRDQIGVEGAPRGSVHFLCECFDCC